MAEIFDLNVTDSSNTGRFPEGQAPSTVNNGARALEGMLARGFRDTIIPTQTSGGTANAQTLTTNQGITAYAAGTSSFVFKAGATNTGACTINVDGLGAKTIKTAAGADLWAGAITSGGYYWIVYDGTNFILLNPTGIADKAVTLAKMADLAANTLIGRATASTGVPEAVGLDSTLAMDTGNLKVVDASATQKGVVQKATQAQTNAGTADRYPSAAEIKGRVFVSSPIEITLGSSGLVSHGLGVRPYHVQAYLVRQSAGDGYAAGEEVPSDYLWVNATRNVQASIPDDTNIKYRVGNNSINLLNDTGAATNMTTSDWRLVLRAWAH